MLWVSMIVRNEADRHLQRTLDCWGEIAGELDARLVVTDDASTDGTVEMCLEAGAEVQLSPEPLFWRHEGFARQRHYDFSTRDAQDGDWVLALDADETISDPALLPPLINVAEQAGTNAVGLPLLEFWTETQYRTDGLWIGTRTTRLYRWQPGGQIRNVEMGCGSEPTYVHTGSVLQQDQVQLHHWGYLREADRVRKHAAYSQRLGGHGHNNTHVDSIITSPTLASYQEAT